MKMSDTNLKIIDAGISLAEHGLHIVTMKDVARVAGISRPTMYAYFHNVEDLRNYIAKQAVERGNEKVIQRLKLDNHPAVAYLT